MKPVNSMFTGFIVFFNMPLGGKIDRLLEKAGMFLLYTRMSEADCNPPVFRFVQQYFKDHGQFLQPGCLL